MAVKRIIPRYTKKYRKCLNCCQAIEKPLKDDEIYTCIKCGQQHLVDVYKDCIALTAVEYAEFRHRPATMLTHEQRQAIRRLIAKADARDTEAVAWINKYQPWLEELAAMPDEQIEAELNIMPEEMRRRVLMYFESRKK